MAKYYLVVWNLNVHIILIYSLLFTAFVSIVQYFHLVISRMSWDSYLDNLVAQTANTEQQTGPQCDKCCIIGELKLWTIPSQMWGIVWALIPPDSSPCPSHVLPMSFPCLNTLSLPLSITPNIWGLEGGAKWTTDGHAHALKLTAVQTAHIASVMKTGDYAPFQVSGVDVEDSNYTFLRGDGSKSQFPNNLLYFFNFLTILFE